MNDLTPEKLAELRRLLDAATPTPWELTEDGYAIRSRRRVVMSPACYPATFDIELIAAAANALPALLDAAAERDALAAKLDAVREWIDRRGVNVDDRDDDYMRGYRDAQRRALLDANGLRAMLDATPETGGES